MNSIHFDSLATSLGESSTRRRFAKLLGALAAALVVALLLGSVLAPSMDAEKMPAKGSIASRVQAQRDLCEVGGGEFEVTKTAFGSTITTCNGGTEDGYTCVNTEKSTDCHRGLTRPPEDPHTPPVGGVHDGSAGGANSAADEAAVDHSGKTRTRNLR